MRLRNLLVTLSLIGLVGFTGCKSKEQLDADAAALKAETDKLQGKWKIVGRDGDKDEEAEEAPADSTGSFYVISGDVLKYVFINKDGKEETLFQQKLGIKTGTTPLQVDLIYIDENGKTMKSRTTKRGITGKRKTTTSDLKDVAIVKVEGDNLTFCISGDEKNRPTDFTAPAKSSRYLLKLEKVKVATEGKTVTTSAK